MRSSLTCGLCGGPIAPYSDSWEFDEIYGPIHSSCWADLAAEEYGYSDWEEEDEDFEEDDEGWEWL